MSTVARRETLPAYPVAGPPTVTISSRIGAAEVLREVRRGWLAGEYGAASDLHYRDGVWAVKVFLIKRPEPPARPWWKRKAVAVGGVAIAALAGIGALVFAALDALARLLAGNGNALLGGALAFVIVGLVLLKGAGGGGGGHSGHGYHWTKC